MLSSACEPVSVVATLMALISDIHDLDAVQTVGKVWINGSPLTAVAICWPIIAMVRFPRDASRMLGGRGSAY